MYYIIDKNTRKVLCHQYYHGNLSADFFLISFSMLSDHTDIIYEYTDYPILDDILDDCENDFPDLTLSLIIVKGLSELKKRSK